MGGSKIEPLSRFIDEALFGYPELSDYRDKIALVLSGSRAVNYHVSSSDYDLLGLCDTVTYAGLLERMQQDPAVKGIDIVLDQEEVKQQFGVEVDVAVYEVDRIREAIRSYNDVVIWIWSNAKIVLDKRNMVTDLKSVFHGYPREILERKLKQHFLKDFHLSVHGLTYRPESKNVFAVVNTLTSKIAEYCRICCLLDAKPFPYEKWLLRACAETELGRELTPMFTRVLATLTELRSDLEQNWPAVRNAIDAIDTEAGDLLEDGLVAWGIDRNWVDRAYHRRHDVLFEWME